MTKSLPLPPRYFQCPALSAREEQYLVAKARESTRALVDATRNNDGPVRWSEMGMHRGVQMYKGEARHPETVVGDPITYGCGATTLQASLDEVANFFDLATHAKVRDFVAFNGDMMDAQLLYALKDPELAGRDPLHQITVRWFVIEMPSKIIKNRDFLTIECQNAFVDVSGRRGWVRSYHSIKLPSCPDLRHEYGLVRGSFYHTGHVFIESERPGYLDVIFSAQINLKGNLRLPSALFFVAAKKRLSSVAELQKQLQKRRLGNQRFLGDLELVPKSQRSRCAICAVKFGMLTRKARCRKCGEVVCSSCSDVWEVAVPKIGTKKMRVCAKCSKSADKHALALTQSHSEVDDDSLSIRSGTPSTATGTGGYAYGQYEKELSPSAASSTTTGTASGRRMPSGYQNNSVGQESVTRSAPPDYYNRNNPRRGPTPTGTSFLSAGNGDAYLSSDNDSDYGEEFEFGHHAPQAPPRGPPRQQPPPQQQGPYGNGSVSSNHSRGGNANGLYRQDSGGRDDPYLRRQQQQPPAPVRYNRMAGNGSDPAARRAAARDPFEEQQARALEMNNQAQLLRQAYQDQQRAMHGYGSAPKADVVSALPPPHHYPSHQSHPSRETQMSDDTVSSASDFDDVSGGAGVTLTPQMLAMHTRQMGKPGPVTRNPAQYAPQGVASRQGPPQQRQPPAQQLSNGAPPYPSKSVSSGYNDPPPRGYGSNQRLAPDEFDQPPAYDQIYAPAPAPAPVANGSERYGRTKSHRSQLSSVDSGAADDYDVRSYKSGRSNTQQQYAQQAAVVESDARSERSQPRFRQVGSSGGSVSSSHNNNNNNNNRPPAYAAPAAHAPSIHSDLDDEGGDQFDDGGVGSPVTNALADNFSNLLRPEDLRSTVESFRFSVGSSTMDPGMSFCESLNDYDENPMPYSNGNSNANNAQPAAAPSAAAPSAAAKPQPVTKTMIVHVYQQVLELTKRQHELDASPTADPAAKAEVARELQQLYLQLGQITQDPEVEL